MKRFILEGALALLLFGLYPQTAKAQRAVHSEEDTKTSRLPILQCRMLSRSQTLL